jgi:geranylgeranyl pyrophosphate synthase
MAAGQAEGFSRMLWPAMSSDRYVSLVEAKAGAMVALPVEAAAILGGLGAEEISRAGRFARALGVAYQLTDDLADVAADLAQGELNGVLVEAVCSGDPARSDALRLALARAADTGIAASDEVLPRAVMQRAAETALRWRDGLLAAAAAELADHPLRRPLFHAATAFAPSLQAPTRGYQHAA